MAAEVVSTCPQSAQSELRDQLQNSLQITPRKYPESILANYETVQALGEGAFGEVLLIMNKNPPHDAKAMKMISLDEEKGEKLTNLKKEYLLHKRCCEVPHENVIQLLNADHTLEHFYLILEYADGGDLFDKIEPDVGMAVGDAQYYFRQLITGVLFLHSQGVVHRDIKPENLLITATTNILKISDFGMATLYRNKDGERLLDVSCGTIPYAAPEIMTGAKYRGTPVDVWSSGVVLIAMLSGELPWDEASDRSLVYLNWLSNLNLDERPWNKMDVRSLCLLRKMLTDVVDSRITMKQIPFQDFYTYNYYADQPIRPLKRRLNDNEQNVHRNFVFSQQAQMESTAKRRHMETPNAKTTLERHNAWFSQPTKADDLLLTQNMEMTQKDANVLQRMVRRMTRFCVKLDLVMAMAVVSEACKNSNYGCRTAEHRASLLANQNQTFMMINFYAMPAEETSYPGVMIDFRRSRGDGLTVRKMFTALRKYLKPFVCANGNTWLANLGIVPEDHRLLATPPPLE